MNEIKDTIKKVHKMYYDGTFLKSPASALEWHRALEILFNYAEIDSTTIGNNPDECSPEEFETKYIKGEK